MAPVWCISITLKPCAPQAESTTTNVKVTAHSKKQVDRNGGPWRPNPDVLHAAADQKQAGVWTGSICGIPSLLTSETANTAKKETNNIRANYN